MQDLWVLTCKNAPQISCYNFAKVRFFTIICKRFGDKKAENGKSVKPSMNKSLLLLQEKDALIFRLTIGGKFKRSVLRLQFKRAKIAISAC